MVFPSHWTTLVILVYGACTVCASDDSGDEFSNNLFSDLAPLLALFGEQVTKQYMSQSFGWADHIVLAMAPLGIITAIVSAIRVGGPSWLRAIIGRARESKAAAEAELQSSTSNEVCEIWDGGQVSRIVGAVPIVGLLYHVQDGTVEICNWYRGRRDDSLMEPASQDHDAEGRPKPIFQYPLEDTPNISLNLHNRWERTTLYLVATVGAIIQLGVLVFSALATYHPQLSFKKGRSPVQGYAYPLAAIGTFMVVAGVLLSGNIVEESTVEKRYPTKREVRLLWLQKSVAIDGQTFKSYLILGKDPVKTITVSTRRTDHDKVRMTKTIIGTVLGGCGFIVQFVGLRGMHWSATIAQLSATLVMTILRALVRSKHTETPCIFELPIDNEINWLATRMEHNDVDRLVRYPYDPNESIPIDEFSSQGCWKWGIPAYTHVSAYRRLVKEKPIAGRAQSILEKQMLLTSLTRWNDRMWVPDALARSIETVMNALFHTEEADEFYWSIDVLAPTPQTSRYPASPENQRDKSQSEPQTEKEKISFKLERQGRKWEVRTPEIDAALSLWIYSARTWKNKQTSSGEELAPGQRINQVRMIGSPRRRLIRDLKWWAGDEILELHQIPESTVSKDIKWSFYGKSIKLRSVERERSMRNRHRQKDNVDQPELIHAQQHGIIGFYGSTSSQVHPEAHEDSHTSQQEFDPVGHVFECDKPALSLENSVLASVSEIRPVGSNNFTRLLSIQVFSTFMWAVAKTLEGPIKGRVTIQSSAISQEDDIPWKHFNIQHETLSNIIQDLYKHNLGSLEDIYLSVIPPLSLEKKLPSACAAICEMARSHAQRHEIIEQWVEATRIYVWIGKKFIRPSSDYIESVQATAIVSVFFLSLVQKIGLYTVGVGRMRPMSETRLHSLRRELVTVLELSHPDILATLGSMYKLQGRDKLFARLNMIENCKPLVFENADALLNMAPTFSGFTVHHANAFSTGRPDLNPSWKASDYNKQDMLGWTPLHYMALVDRKEYNDISIDGNVEIDSKDLAGWTPLHYASQNGGRVTLLLRHGANPNVVGRDNTSPLHYAKNLKVWEHLVQAGANINARDASLRSTFHWAILMDRGEMIDQLCRKRVNLDLLGARDRDGSTPAHVASHLGMEKIVEALLEQDISLKDSKDRAGNMPLHCAAGGGHEFLVEYLAGLNENGCSSTNDTGETPLHRAADMGKEAMVKFLVNKLGANCNARDDAGNSPLHLAVLRKRNSVVRSLIVSLRADREAQNNEGKTPLHLGAEFRCLDEVRELINLGADCEAKSNNGETPLHLAAADGNHGIVSLLVELGADLKAQKNNGETPLHLAATGGHYDIVQLLVELGADCNAQNNDGETPLHVAAANGNDSIAHLLVELGAEIKSDSGQPELAGDMRR